MHNLQAQQLRPLLLLLCRLLLPAVLRAPQVCLQMWLLSPGLLLLGLLPLLGSSPLPASSDFLDAEKVPFVPAAGAAGVAEAGGAGRLELPVLPDLLQAGMGNAAFARGVGAAGDRAAWPCACCSRALLLLVVALLWAPAMGDGAASS
jgi:hypothetical protein